MLNSYSHKLWNNSIRNSLCRTSQFVITFIEHTNEKYIVKVTNDKYEDIGFNMVMLAMQVCNYVFIYYLITF